MEHWLEDVTADIDRLEKELWDGARFKELSHCKKCGVLYTPAYCHTMGVLTHSANDTVSMVALSWE